MTPLQALAYYNGLSPEDKRVAFVEAVSQATSEQFSEAVDVYVQVANESWWRDFCRRYPT